MTQSKEIFRATCSDRKRRTCRLPIFTDIDGDGKLEFGGFDITEVYNSKDSMYYNPSQYYTIINGKVKFDSALTKKMDLKINGIYLSKPLDKEGNCCIVIKKPRKQSSR